jgi:hypothetical protein
MKRFGSFAAALLAAFAFRPAAAEPAPPVAVELFTSQGCYSCPPAEAFLGELAKRPDVIALEWHVDYWDDLVYGSAGQWKDPFSMPEATARQYAYNRQISGRGRAYTPQMIVAGSREMVGSQRDRVEAAVRRARGEAPKVGITFETGPDGRISVDAGGAAATLWRVDFLKTRITKVARGENKGKILESHHIVRGKSRIGEVSDGPVAVEAPREGYGCAILAQVGEVGPVLAAAYCPGSAANS